MNTAYQELLLARPNTTSFGLGYHFRHLVKMLEALKVEPLEIQNVAKPEVKKLLALEHGWGSKENMVEYICIYDDLKEWMKDNKANK